MSKYIILCMAICLASVNAQAITTIDDFDNSKSNVRLNLDVAGQSGNTNKVDISSGLKSKFNINNDFILGIISGEYGKSNGVDNSKALFIHLRYINMIFKNVGYEIFTQYEYDKFSELQNRTLLGGGSRFKYKVNEKINLTSGLGGFFELEKRIGVKASNLIRINYYLKSKYSVNKKTFTLAGYYQPNISDFSDYRTYVTADFSTTISSNVNLIIGVRFKTDSIVPSGVKHNDLKYTSGLEVLF